MRCIHCIVRGRVQGVWFRASTRDVALQLGINGSAVNLSDGGVEVVACGDEDGLKRLRQWLQQGPPGARVTDLSCEPIPVAKRISGFEIG